MRAFLAIDIPDELKRCLTNLVSKLNPCQSSQLRPVRSNNLHITLKFLPHVAVTQIRQIVTATSSAVSNFESFSLDMGAIGCFPDIRNPTTLWVGIDQPNTHLQKLHIAIRNALESLGCKPANGIYSPHITLGRFRTKATRNQRQVILERLDYLWLPEKQSFIIDQISLVKSELNRDGAQYSLMARIPLQRS